ncbi:hypothetical protein BMS3Abin15_00182 [bacterium BMS3Abin15]|nr:hypothetical protein BMS3Abin15_00182 [bacterium BMS3Abin15]
MAVVLFVLYKVALFVSLKHSLYPSAPEMPPVVDTSTEELLNELGNVLKAKVPRALEALQSGLSSEEIAKIERDGDFRLPDDIKALYKWRNGSRIFYNDNKTPAYDGPIPGHRFLPLDDAVKIRAILKKTVR